VWSGDEVEITEKDVCDGCKEDTDTSYDGMCMPCWEELNEHLEEEM
jgi:predicted amidophosphoribosyltransferase